MFFTFNLEILNNHFSDFCSILSKNKINLSLFPPEFCSTKYSILPQNIVKEEINSENIAYQSWTYNMHQKNLCFIYWAYINTCASEGSSPIFFKAFLYYTFLRGNGFVFTHSISRQFLMLKQSHFFPSDSSKKLRLSAIYVIGYSFLNIEAIFQFKQSKC